MSQSLIQDDIIAIATPSGQGAIGIIRLSGPNCISIVDTFFRGKNLSQVEGNTIHYGKIVDHQDQILDECLASVFRAPRSYTKEDVVELSCHGSSYILKAIVKLFIHEGVRHARPGEFTMRAFVNGQVDLPRAEAICDLINSETASQHQIAMNQMRGGFSKSLGELKENLIEFASLLELENDFGEEDVEFADRSQLSNLISTAHRETAELIRSFDYGNAIKNGIAVSIIGKPNVGKSTLLNALLKDDKAIISDIPGTTRDVIEDMMIIEGMKFRFLDTAGIRDTTDTIESIGIAKTYESISKSNIILYVTEISEDHKSIVEEAKSIELKPDQQLIILLNKTDTFHTCHRYDIEEAVSTLTKNKCLAISAKNNEGIDQLKDALTQSIKLNNPSSQTIVSNLRHYESLSQLHTHLQSITDGLSNQYVSSDLLAIDIRHALHHIGELTGTISTDDLLDNIFNNFCIGK